MNSSSNNFSDFPEEIKINKIKLSLEKLENLQRISLRKKINFQKQSLLISKTEKDLESNLNSLKENNEDLKNKIENLKENIRQSNTKNKEIKNQADKLDEKIEEIEALNSKDFGEVENFY